MREELLSEEQRRFQTRLGLRLKDAEARVFAFACRKGRVSLADAKAITGLIGADAKSLLEVLEGQGVTQRLQEGLYGLAPHLEGHAVLPSLGPPGRDQVRNSDVFSEYAPRPGDSNGKATRDFATEQPMGLSEQQSRIVTACVSPRSLAELMTQAGVTHRSFFRNRHLKPLLEAGIVRMTNPASPNAANQRYILTRAGQNLMARQAGVEREEKAYAQD